MSCNYTIITQNVLCKYLPILYKSLVCTIIAFCYISAHQRVEIQVQRFAAHNVVRVAAFMKLHLHGLILSTRSYQSENLSPLELSISYFDILLLDGTLKQEPTRVTLWWHPGLGRRSLNFPSSAKCFGFMEIKCQL